MTQTKVPWLASTLQPAYIIGPGPDFEIIASIAEFNEDGKAVLVFENGTGNRDFIVRACNAHDALVAENANLREALTTAQQRAQVDEALRLRTALQAIMARLEGNFDHPALVALGPLTTPTADIGTLASEALGDKR